VGASVLIGMEWLGGLGWQPSTAGPGFHRLPIIRGPVRMNQPLAPFPAPRPAPLVRRGLWTLPLAVLAGCGWTVQVNQPLIPCPEISAAAFEDALSRGAVRGEVALRSNGPLRSSQVIIGSNTLRTCTPAAARGGSQDCRFSNTLVVRYDSEDRGIYYVMVPSGRWHRFLQRNPPGACRLLP